MVLHVALLGESDAAQLTLERLLPRVFDHMDLQRALLIEGLVALIALEGTLACAADKDRRVRNSVFPQLASSLFLC